MRRLQLRPWIQRHRMEAYARPRDQPLEAAVGDQGDLVSGPGQGVPESGVWGGHIAPGARRRDRCAHVGQYGGGAAEVWERPVDEGDLSSVPSVDFPVSRLYFQRDYVRPSDLRSRCRTFWVILPH